LNTPVLHIDIDNPSNFQIPETIIFERYLIVLCQQLAISEIELSVYIADEMEIKAINLEHRGINKPTNVLSFPFERPVGLPDDIEPNFVGDIIICPTILEKEAIEQAKSNDAHWAHLFIHAVLHLYNFDHITPEEAEVMESLEIELLKQLDFHNPYEMDKI
jgi:probable rRNA maturation factor